MRPRKGHCVAQVKSQKSSLDTVQHAGKKEKINRQRSGSHQERHANDGLGPLLTLHTTFSNQKWHYTAQMASLTSATERPDTLYTEHAST
eukprot:1159509-Pelagomonas_calceolata.AAC.4